MAVAAGRHALNGGARAHGIGALTFASTTMPFADRQNATLIGEALNLPVELRANDTGGSLRAGVAALRAAMEATVPTLVVAAEKRLTRPGSMQELRIGDGAAAIVVDEDNLLAEYVGSYASSVDFTDHYRSTNEDFDYVLEERWARDEGYMRIVPPVIRRLLERAGVDAGRIAHFVAAGLAQRDAKAVARGCGIAEDAATADLHGECGDTGTAHPLLLLTKALQAASPGELILVLGYGQGAEALLFRATDRVGKSRELVGADVMLADGLADDNYMRFLSFNGHVAMDWGMRAERDNRTAQAAFYRHRDTVTRMVGGRCTSCDTPQYPRTRVCANPECRAADTQVPEPFAEKAGEVKSFTEDWLALSFNPPLMYGNIRFAGGGVAMLEFSDFAPGDLAVGGPLEMIFRIKDIDDRRGFRRYCWKAGPPRQLGAKSSIQGKDNG